MIFNFFSKASLTPPVEQPGYTFFSAGILSCETNFKQEIWIPDNLEKKNQFPPHLKKKDFTYFYIPGNNTESPLC